MSFVGRRNPRVIRTRHLTYAREPGAAVAQAYLNDTHVWLLPRAVDAFLGHTFDPVLDLVRDVRYHCKVASVAKRHRGWQLRVSASKPTPAAGHFFCGKGHTPRAHGSTKAHAASAMAHAQGDVCFLPAESKGWPASCYGRDTAC